MAPHCSTAPQTLLGPASSATAQAPSSSRQLASRRGPLTLHGGRWVRFFSHSTNITEAYPGPARRCPRYEYVVRLTRSVTHRTRCVMEGGRSEVGCMVHGGDMEQGRSVWEGGRAEGAACAKALGGEGAGRPRGQGGASASAASMQWRDRHRKRCSCGHEASGRAVAGHSGRRRATVRAANSAAHQRAGWFSAATGGGRVPPSTVHQKYHASHTGIVDFAVATE